jgi:cell wall-associated NlpC family hydrolase
MKSIKLFPCVVVACLSLALSATASAQNGASRARIASQLAAVPDVGQADFDKDDVIVISEAPADDTKLARIPNTTVSSDFQNLISAAIDERLGAGYKWGATGPGRFDCSGFVWSIFQAAGINFERASARTLWSRFEAPAEDEQYKFGTLVFFSNLAHVGVVADEKGFYHASRHHGVIYSPFSDYWVARLDGFRKVPANNTLASAGTKSIE